jgi:dTMP kinase
MKKLKKGILISLEGIDGSGKSLLAKKLFNTFKKEFYKVVLTKEPGETNLGKKIRKILQEQTINVCNKAEYLLFAADRAQHFEEFIIPKLNNKNLILSDRLGDSSVVYQGYGRNLDIDTLKKINKWAMQGIEPNLILYIKIDPKTSIERVLKRNLKLTAFEKEKLDFVKRLTIGYSELYKNKKNVFILNGNLPPKKLMLDAYNKIINWLDKNKILL